MASQAFQLHCSSGLPKKNQIMTWGWVCGSDSDDKSNLSCQLNLHWACWAGTEIGKKWKNVHIIHNVDYFEMSVGGPDFQISPKFKWLKYDLDFDDIWVIYWSDIRKIWYMYG